MNILLVGAGGCEHALAWSIAQSPLLNKLFIAPGNPGMAQIGQLVPVDITHGDLVLDVARHTAIDLVIIGSELPLAVGLADACRAAELRVFGPTSAVAQMECSRVFAKQLMSEASIPTAQAHIFPNAQQAQRFASSSERLWVVKADQSIAGQSVFLPNDEAAMLAAITQIEARGGGSILLEERLDGHEVSLFALCDGERLLLLPPARVYRRLHDSDQGSLTAGMGAYAPMGVEWEELQWIQERCLLPIVRTLAAAGTPLRGVLRANMMLTADGPCVLSLGASFGDPATQVILPLLEGDFLEALVACVEGRLDPGMLAWRGGAAVSVVVAAPGYPENPQVGSLIQGIEALDQPGILMFQNGTAWERGQLVTAGGRVVSVTSTAATLGHARKLAYVGAESISFPGMQYRRDIALP